MSFLIRPAKPEDVEAIHRLVKELAAYEKEPDAVEATPETYRQQIQQKNPPFECLVAEVNNIVVGFALFFQSYSSWEGKPGMFLHDLYISPEYRSGGIGKAFLKTLAQIAVKRKYGRLEWSVLDWNKPALQFYKSIGAAALDEWTTWRLSGDALSQLGSKQHFKYLLILVHAPLFSQTPALHRRTRAVARAVHLATHAHCWVPSRRSNFSWR